MTNQPQIEALHRHYCALTGHSMPLTMPRIYAWEAWLANHFVEADLVLVVRHLQRKIPDRMKLMAALNFPWLIQRTDCFEENLSEARALARVPRRNPDRESVLRATGRESEPDPDHVRTAEQVLQSEAFKQFVNLKGNL